MDEIDYAAIGKRISEVRNLNGITLTELSVDTGLDSAFISRVENGIKRPSLATLLQLAEYFNITLDDLIPYSKGRNNNAYYSDFKFIMGDCSNNERKIIIDVAAATKQALRNNKNT